MSGVAGDLGGVQGAHKERAECLCIQAGLLWCMTTQRNQGGAVLWFVWQDEAETDADRAWRQRRVPHDDVSFRMETRRMLASMTGHVSLLPLPACAVRACVSGQCQ